MGTWLEKTTESHYGTVTAIQQSLEEGDFEAVRSGLEALREAMSRSEQRALRSQLIRLMMHILKWKTQPARRTRSWVSSIVQARHAIEDIQLEVPSLNRVFIEQVWDYCMQRAIREAQAEMGVSPTITSLGWQEVFDDAYDLPID
jgi:DNA-binding FrmR family transcriptional regulator